MPTVLTRGQPVQSTSSYFERQNHKKHITISLQCYSVESPPSKLLLALLTGCAAVHLLNATDLDARRQSPQMDGSEEDHRAVAGLAGVPLRRVALTAHLDAPLLAHLHLAPSLMVSGRAPCWDHLMRLHRCGLPPLHFGSQHCPHYSAAIVQSGMTAAGLANARSGVNSAPVPFDPAAASCFAALQWCDAVSATSGRARLSFRLWFP